MSTDFSQLCSDYWQHLLSTDPTIGRSVADRRLSHLLLKESLDDITYCYQTAQGFLKKLNAIDKSVLTSVDSRSFQLLERELNNTVADFEFERHLRHEFFPFTPDFKIEFYLNDNAILNSRDADDYLKRLATIPSILIDIQERIKAGCQKGYRLPAILLDAIVNSAINQTQRAVTDSGYFKPLKGRLAEKYPQQAKQAEAIIVEDVYPALIRWSEFVKNELGQYTTSDNCLSKTAPDYYAYLVTKETLGTVRADEIHQLGLKEVARIQVEMERVARIAGFSDADDLKEHLTGNKEYVSESAAALSDKIAILSKKIDGLIPEYFNLIPRTTYSIKSIDPESSATMPPAFAQPNPANGSSGGIHWLTSLPEKCPSFMHTPLALHEAWPGHLMHIAILQEQDDLPEFQLYRPLEYNAYIEGWALYCERLGHDMRLYDDPVDYFGQLDMEMWRATRLVVDTGIHLYDWSRERACKYMQTYLSISEATIAAEVDRYIGMPAQALSYKMGEICIQSLRNRCEQALSDKFSLREFHRQLMICGPITLDLLEQHIDEWIRNVQAE